MGIKEFFEVYKPQKIKENEYKTFFLDNITDLLAKKYNFKKVSSECYTYKKEAIITYSEGDLIIELFDECWDFYRRLNEIIGEEDWLCLKDISDTCLREKKEHQN